MAESTFRIPSTITIDNIVLDASSPLDSEVFVFNGTSFVVDSVVPIGTIEMWAGLSSAIPSGWLLCDGGQYAIGSTGSQYYALSQVITTRYGAYTNGSGGAGSSHFRVPDMTAYVPIGITSGANAGATTASYAATSLAHNHTLTANATTNADGASHSHTLSDGGSHNHSLVTSNWNHSHNTGGPSATHRHNIGTANQPSTNATGNTAHDATQHGFFATDNAQVHSHTTGTQTSNATHGHTIPTSTTLSHSHTWSNSATSDSANTTAHNHTLNVVPICFIIKF
jgi:microcystin-dependent protein